MNQDLSLDPEVRRLLGVWNALAPPLRPSPQDVEFYARGWKNREGSRVLIQGVTPELVDLALRKKAARIITMDCSRPHLSAMRLLGREDWTKVEELQNDWRVFVPALEGNLDLVLGDGSLTMLAFPAEWESVLRDIRRYLVPGGRIVFRLSFQPDSPFDIDTFMRETMSGLDARCSRARPDQKLQMLREAVSEIRLAFGLASAGSTGAVDLVRRAELVHLFHSEFAARYGHWKEWDLVRIGMPSEVAIWKQNQAGKAVPQWNAAVELTEACGFRLKSLHRLENRPAPGVMRLFVAERQ